MPDNPGEPVPMRLLDEYAGEAVVPPDIEAEMAAAPAVGAGDSVGMSALPESLVELGDRPQPVLPPSPSATPPPAIRDGMAALIGQIGEPFRTVLSLRLSGLDVGEIARRLGVAERDIRRQLTDGMIDLRGVFHDYQRRLLAG